MAAAKDTATRTAVTATGNALLALIAAADGGKLYLTQDEGSAAFSAGMISVDTNDADSFGAIAATLTDAGKAALAADTSTAEQPKPAAAATASSFAIDDGIPMPARTSRGGSRESAYPFDALNVGQSFHIPKTEANPDPAMKIASSVSGARVKYAVPVMDTDGVTPKTETVKVPVYQKTEDGKAFVKDAEGKRVKTGEEDKVKPVVTFSRDFAVKTVDATDPKGAGARVWRTK